MNKSGNHSLDEKPETGEALYWIVLFTVLITIFAHNVVTSPLKNQGKLFVAGYFAIMIINFAFGKAMPIGVITVKRDTSLYSRIIRPFGACIAAYALANMYLK